MSVDYAGCTPPWLAGPGRPDHLIAEDILLPLLAAGLSAWVDDGVLRVDAADGTELHISCGVDHEYQDTQDVYAGRNRRDVGTVRARKPTAFMAALAALCKAEGIDLLGQEEE